MPIPDSGFNDVLSKLVAGEMRKRVYNQLGAIVNDLPASSLTPDEKKQAKLQILDMLEQACKEFFPEMRKRVETGESPNNRRTRSHDRDRDPNFPD